MKRRTIISFLAFVTTLFLTSCSSITQEQYDEIVQNYEQLEAEKDKLQEEKEQLIQKRDYYKDAYEQQLREASDHLYQEVLSELNQYKDADMPNENESEDEDKPSGDTEIIESTIRTQVRNEYTMTDIDSITINDDLGTDTEGDYIALIYLTWNQKNNPELTKKVLQMYSDDLAATICESHSNVQEVAVFWSIPYLNDADVKISYEQKSGAMYQSDSIWPAVFN